MTAWILIIGIGTNFVTAIPGVASKAECERLASVVPIAGIFPHQCISYQMAK